MLLRLKENSVWRFCVPILMVDELYDVTNFYIQLGYLSDKSLL